jgi:hypothetical protein
MRGYLPTPAAAMAAVLDDGYRGDMSAEGRRLAVAGIGGRHAEAVRIVGQVVERVREGER